MSITKAQWMVILVDGLGLRSGNAPDDLGGASYSMDNGVDQAHPVAPIPHDWDKRLKETIARMKDFSNSEGRYLLIVSPSRGDSFEYMGCFPKCSAKPTKVLFSKDLEQKVDDLVEWVCNKIPDKISP